MLHDIVMLSWCKRLVDDYRRAYSYEHPVQTSTWSRCICDPINAREHAPSDCQCCLTRFGLLIKPAPGKPDAQNAFPRSGKVAVEAPETALPHMLRMSAGLSGVRLTARVRRLLTRLWPERRNATRHDTLKSLRSGNILLVWFGKLGRLMIDKVAE